MARHSHRIRTRRRLAVTFATAALLAAACGNSNDEGSTTTAAGTSGGDGPANIEGVNGVTDDTISFAVTGTGAANPLGYCLLDCFNAGVQAYFDYYNDENGGIDGRELVVGKVVDDELANSKVKMLELVSDPEVFGIFSAPIIVEGYTDANAANVPVYGIFQSSPAADGLDSIFIPGGTTCVGCTYPTTVHGAVLAEKSVVASLGFGIAQVSKDCAQRVEKDVEKYGGDQGVTFGYLNDDLQYGLPNGVGPEVTAMKEAGVDYIYTCIDQNSVVTLEQELHRQGMDDVVVVLPQGYGDAEYLTTNADLLEGDQIALPYRPLEANPGDSDIETMTEWLTKAGAELNDYAIQGWMDAQLAVAGIEAAGSTFDQASVVAATNQITDFTYGGLFPKAIDWTTAHNARSEDGPGNWCSAFLLVNSEGTLDLQGDKDKPMYCWEMPLDGWVDPEITG